VHVPLCAAPNALSGARVLSITGQSVGLHGDVMT
jgi:hypothetical protein